MGAYREHPPKNNLIPWNSGHLFLVEYSRKVP
jgi:hypothetical protein